ncbi:MAG: sugar ABC transporter substrate-binding protein [Candidatus Atribacteria bacterium]|nr:sugar ABC transporter substrate-binding protein [Candidatus Atribacteria bacterium]
MKKVILLVLIGVLVLSCASGVFAQEKKFKVGYACISWSFPFMVAYQPLFVEELKKYPDYEVIFFDAKGDYQALADGLENFIAQKVDLIMNFALDSLPMIETYKKIKAAGIPLLLTMDEPDFEAYPYMDCFSGLSPRDAGRQCADELHRVLKGQGKVALITATKGSTSEIQYTGGFMNELSRLNSGLEVVAIQPGDWDISIAQKAASDILTKYPDIDGFYVSDDWMGGGIVRALKEKGYEPGEVKIAAAGGSKIGIKDLQDGWYVSIVDQGPVLCVLQDIFIMRCLLEKIGPVPHFAMVKQELITQENIDRFPGTW